MKKNIIVFVDENILYVNNWKVNKLALINKQLKHAATNWNELLTTTGDGLELTNCSHDILHC